MIAFLTRLYMEPGVVLKRLIDCFVCWGNPGPKGEMEEAEIVVTQAGPNLIGGKSSQTNTELAQVAKKYCQDLCLPIFPQGEIGELLLSSGVVIAAITKHWSDFALWSKEYGTGTEEVARTQVNFCQKHDYRTAVVIAFRPHIWRAMWVYERMGLQVFVPPDLPKLRFEKEFSVTQRHWRSPLTAYPYELLARLYFLYKGYI